MDPGVDLRRPVCGTARAEPRPELRCRQQPRREVGRRHGVGRICLVPLAFIGGLLIGVAEAVLTKQVSSQQNFLIGLPQAVPFIVLFVALLAIPRKKFRDTFFPLPHAIECCARYRNGSRSARSLRCSPRCC